MNFKRILVPVTLSAESCSALAIASDLAEKFGSSLILLHAVQLNIAGEERGIPRMHLMQQLCQDSEQQLRQWATNAGVAAGVECVVCEGRPADVIVEKANRLDVDVIVMGARGHSRWFRWMHRRTVLRVLRSAPCPVWLVSPGRQNEAIVLTIIDRVPSNNNQQRRLRHEHAHPLPTVV